MRHEGCEQIQSLRPTQDMSGQIQLDEVVCVHGWRWFEGPTVEDRGWKPRGKRRHPCSYCGQALPETAIPQRRYCTERCQMRAAKRKAQERRAHA